MIIVKLLLSYLAILYLMKSPRLIISVALLGLSLIFSSYPVNSFGQSRNDSDVLIDSLWKKIYLAQKEELPTSAITYAEELYDLAKAKDSYQHMVLATEVIIENNSLIDVRQKNEIIREYSSKTSDFKDTVAQTLFKCNILKHLASYFHFDKVHLEGWINALKTRWTEEILANRNELKGASSSDWRRLIDSTVFMSEYKNASVYEYALLSIINSMNESDYVRFSDVIQKYIADPDYYNFFNSRFELLFKELLDVQITHPDNYLISKMMYFSHRNTHSFEDISDNTKIGDYEQIVNQYKEYPNVTLFVNELVLLKERNIKKQSGSYSELLKYCEYWIKKHPRGAGTNSLISFKSRIIQPYIFFDGPRQFAPGKEFNIDFSHKNVNEGELLIFKVNNPLSLLKSAESIRLCRNIDSLLKTDASLYESQKLYFKNSVFGYSDSKALPTRIDDEGAYILKFISKEINNALFLRFFINDTTVVHRFLNSRNYFIPLNINTGEPIKEATLIFAQQKSNPINYKVDSVNIFHKGHYQFNGFTMIDIPDLTNIKRVVFKVGNHTPYSFLNTYYNPFAKKDNYLQVFSDRRLYRSGDTVYYKVFSFNKKNGINVNNSQKLIVRITDVKGAVIHMQNLETNEFGSASGSFFIGKTIQNGTYSITITESETDNQDPYPVQYTFKVEDYKSDSFYITTEKIAEGLRFGDSITITGSINSYSGFPVSGARILYTVATEMFHNKIHRRYNFASFKSFETISDSLGKFSISFKLTRDSSIYHVNENMAQFHVQIRSILSNSESAISNVSFIAGDLPVRTYIYSRKVMCAQRDVMFNIRAYSGFGTEVILNANYHIVSSGMDKQDILIKGKAVTFEDIKPDLTGLESGNYKFMTSVRLKDGQIVRDSTEFTLFHLDDTQVPKNGNPFFLYPLRTEQANKSIEFLLGTSEEKIYAQLELITEDSVVYRESLIVEKGMKKHSLSIPAANSDLILLSITSVLKGRPYTVNETYKIENKKSREIKLFITNLKKRVSTSNNETLTINLRDVSGNPVTDAEVMVSIFDKRADKWMVNNFFLQTLKIPLFSLYPTPSSGLGRGDNYTEREIFTYEEEQDIPYMMQPYSSVSVRGNGRSDVANSTINDIVYRRNFKETLLFKPHLYPDLNGEVKVNYNTGDLTSTFRIMLLAHDKSLNNNYVHDTFVVNRDLMITTNLPKLVREGDSISAKSMVINLTEKPINAFYETSVTDKSGTKSERYEIFLGPGEQKYVSSNINIPISSKKTNDDSVTVRISVSSDMYSDGEEHKIKIIPSWRDANQATVIHLGTSGKYAFPLLDENSAINGTPDKFTATLSSPLELLYEDLRNMQNPESEDLFSYLNSLYARSYFKDSTLNEFTNSAFTRFERQFATNRFISWYPGMAGSFYLSYLFLEKINDILNMGSIVINDNQMGVIKNVIEATDNHFLYQHQLHLKRKNEFKSDFIPLFNAIYLRVRPLYTNFPISDLLKNSMNYYLDSYETRDISGSVMENAYIAAALMANKREGAYMRYLASIKEHAVKNERGVYYFPGTMLTLRDLTSNEISNHAFLLNLFIKTGDLEYATGISKWILLQKENQHWDKGMFITDAVDALSNLQKINGVNKAGKESSKSTMKVDPKRNIVKINKNNNHPEYLYILRTFPVKDSEVKDYSNGISIERRFFKITVINGSEKKIEVIAGDTLDVGDIIEVESTIQNSDNRSYVIYECNLPASFVALKEFSGYNGIYYKVVNSSFISYSYDFLPAGAQIIKERFLVNNKGTFSSGTAIVKSLLNPAYFGYGENKKVIVR